MNSLFLTDGYKLTHHMQYPKGTTKVVSNFTPRSSKYAFPQAQDGVVVFGIQYMLKSLKEHFDKNFFMTELRNSPYADSKRIMDEAKADKIDELREEFTLYTGVEYDTSHFEALWDLGYLPIEVRAIEEGSVVPVRVPVLMIQNTIDEFYWITNYLETLISNLLWKPMTSATIARAYKKILVKWAEKTDKDNMVGVDFQGHDFSMRGLDSIEAAVASGLGHITSFNGSDSLPVISGARKFYNAPKGEFVMGGVPATEHSVMCAGTKDDEIGTFKRLMDTFPNGFLSIVSDTWSLWYVLTYILPELKEQILGRDGKLVIRPDSGDPVDILCGQPYTHRSTDELNYILQHVIGEKEEAIENGETFEYNVGDTTFIISKNSITEHPKHKGVVELLWETFGGTTNSQGYKLLDSHIGAIYGDSITLDRAEEIMRRLEAKGFASTNVVLGIGSFTYQFNTRDTYGFAMKATYVEITSIVGEHQQLQVEGRPIFKDPITDDGMKKSAKGLVKVIRPKGAHGMGNYTLVDEVSWEEVEADDNELKVVFKDGEFIKETTLEEVRKRLS